MSNGWITDIMTNVQTGPGRPLPLGATIVGDNKINFAVYSAHASDCVLVVYPITDENQEPANSPILIHEMLAEYKVGDVFTLEVSGLDPATIEYAFSMKGPQDISAGHRFRASDRLLDPYARQISGRNQWGVRPSNGSLPTLRAQIPTEEPFDWEGDRPLELPMRDLIIYEMHVRGFTQHESSGVQFPGTYAGLIEKIPYLQELGVNCVELLPVQEFDEFESIFVNPFTGERLKQFWGYGTLGFFAPKAGYAAAGAQRGQVNEFKQMVKALHAAGIEVMLDVVYNHTGEGGVDGHAVSFKGLDNKTYFMLTPEGEYHNYSGTGNTLNCNHPVVIQMIIDSLRHWVVEYHIDGFRFDLASIFARSEENGEPLDDPPLIKAIARDPILANTKIVAEAWDASGLYQVGSFPHYGRWSEWNGKFRDHMRRFLKGDAGMVGDIIQRILGSPDIYGGRRPEVSVNFINCHDGFTLADLFSYNEKHNLANGEENRDGNNDNQSWNCGVEGPSHDEVILNMRGRLMRGALSLLMVSQGVPLFHMGDEIAHTKRGNNNTYGQDNDLSWLNWSSIEANRPLLRFAQNLIAFRKRHPLLRSAEFLNDQLVDGQGYAAISWHGVEVGKPDWTFHSHTFAFMLAPQQVVDPNQSVITYEDDFIYVVVNMHWRSLVFELPKLPAGYLWHLFADTGRKYPFDSHRPGEEPELSGQQELVVDSRSVAILVGRRSVH